MTLGERLLEQGMNKTVVRDFFVEVFCEGQEYFKGEQKEKNRTQGATLTCLEAYFKDLVVSGACMVSDGLSTKNYSVSSILLDLPEAKTLDDVNVESSKRYALYLLKTYHKEYDLARNLFSVINAALLYCVSGPWRTAQDTVAHKLWVRPYLSEADLIRLQDVGSFVYLEQDGYACMVSGGEIGISALDYIMMGLNMGLLSNNVLA